MRFTGRKLNRRNWSIDCFAPRIINNGDKLKCDLLLFLLQRCGATHQELYSAKWFESSSSCAWQYYPSHDASRWEFILSASIETFCVVEKSCLVKKEGSLTDTEKFGRGNHEFHCVAVVLSSKCRGKRFGYELLSPRAKVINSCNLYIELTFFSSR